MKKRFFFISLIVTLIFAGFGCKQSGPTADVQKKLEPVTLNYWRVFDDQDAFDSQIQAYQAQHPNVTINYRKLRYEEYERELLNALAEDRGPDVFSIQNTWMRSYKNKLEPKPESVTMVYQTVTGGIQREVVTELKTRNTITLRELQDRFVDVVYGDVVLPDRDTETGVISQNVYGLPLSVDTLALFYNKSLLNNAGLPQAATSWSDFQEQVKRITRYDARGDITLAGGAIGTSNNVARGVDILALLMMQNGAVMMTDEGAVAFNQIPRDQIERISPPGEEALRFYTDFASPVKDVYTWNDTMQNSIDAFIAGQVAYMFGYSYHIPTIKSRAPKLNMGIAKVPQIAGNPEINSANYWVEVVSKKTKNADIAWDFVEFLTDADQAKVYLDKTSKPTALRGFVVNQLSDLTVGVFASQVLTAKSWYRGHNAVAADNIMGDLINDVLLGRLETKEALDLAAGRIQDTVQSAY